MVAGSFTREHVSPVGIDRIWRAGILDGHNLVPKILPEYITQIELLEGDGGAGTVKKFHFTEAVKEFKFAVDKTEALDNENHIVKLSVIEGGFIGLRLKSYSFEIKFVVGSAGDTVEKITVDHDTLDDTPLSAEEEDQVLAGIWLMTKAIEEHLLANPTAYA
ncbi:Major pollen allergen Bet v 1-A [Platanthera zijinensis]|uniref:Major pollen allergen Bet v 1-A n=1 Tax=Platanthera zijinensis TaxID=2320716 RepID=A0AAP0BP60_9ASPA